MFIKHAVICAFMNHKVWIHQNYIVINDTKLFNHFASDYITYNLWEASPISI